MADYAADPEKGHQTTFATGEKGGANGQVVLRGLDQDAPEGAVHRAWLPLLSLSRARREQR